PEGDYDPSNVPDFDADELSTMLRGMLFQRVLDRRMVSLQRRGELGTFGEGAGQEASIIGSAFAFEPEDWVFPTGRMSAVAWMLGVSVETLVKYWRGIPEAGRMDGTNCFPFAIEIGSHLPMAVGVAQAAGLAGNDHVVGAYVGDGGTSTGAYAEAMNYSGVRSAPFVLVNQNNQWAISVPYEEQTNAETLAQKAVAFGIEGIRVDGNDVLAVADATRRARDLASEGTPTVLELVTYRMGAHTTNDDPTRYRSDEEVTAWKRHDPVNRFLAFLDAEGYGEELDPDAIEAELDREISDGIEAADEIADVDIDEVFEHLHEDMPEGLRTQRESFGALVERRPDITDHVEQRPKG
ncbi:MAG: thiamine pyrophosphate-dependent enzyme, partial [Halobacteriales archaeon]|nr:thiamine pyrophosphate-dependent enzyme [Halobacteriales archaeon]